MMLVAVFNHLLAQQAALRHALAVHAGKVAEISAPPLSGRFLIQADGYFAATQEAPLTTLRFPASLLPRLALRDDTAYRAIEVDGDAALGAEVGKVLKALRWDAEEDLSRLVGDVLAHRLTGVAAGMFGTPGEFVHRLARQYAEHWTEEAPMLAKQDDVARFLTEVDRIRDDAERLEKLLQQLDQRLKPSHPA